MTTPPDDARPLLRVVRGEPTDTELAALVAVVAARAAAARRPTSPVVRSRWAAPTPRRVLRAGPGAWAASGR